MRQVSVPTASYCKTRACSDLFSFSMSSSLGLLCRRCTFSFVSPVSTPAIRSRSFWVYEPVHARQLSSRSANLLRSSLNGTSSQRVANRRFSSSPVALAKRVEKKKAPSKHQLALIAKRKATKRGKDAYANERMTLDDAISVLRVGFLSLHVRRRSLAVF